MHANSGQLALRQLPGSGLPAGITVPALSAPPAQADEKRGFFFEFTQLLSQAVQHSAATFQLIL